MRSKANRLRTSFSARAAVETRLETELLREGGVLPSILRKTIGEATP